RLRGARQARRVLHPAGSGGRHEQGHGEGPRGSPMNPDIGHFCLSLGFRLAIIQALLPLIGSVTGNRPWLAAAQPLAEGRVVRAALRLAELTLALPGGHFSLLYAVNRANSLLPWYYKTSAVWGAHEGSLLLWVLTLAGWTAAVALFSRSLPLVLAARVLAVM